MNLDIYSEKIKKIWKSFFARSVSYEVEGIRPQRDWTIAVSSTLIGFCVVSVCAWYIYGEVIGGAWFHEVPDTTTPSTMIDQSLLRTTVDAIDARAVLLEHSVTPPSDPSL